MTTTPETLPSPRGALAALSLAILLASLGTSIANVALPTLTDAFDASFQKAQWVVVAYLLASTVVIVSVGRLGDVAGRRRLLLAGLALFTSASAFCGVAPTLGTLIAARAAQGIGAAIMLALAMALVGETVPRARTGSAMGLLGTMSAVGTFLGPSVGGLLIAAFGWRAIFLVTVPLGVLTVLLAHRHLPADRRVSTSDRAAFDRRGALRHAPSLIMSTLVAAVLMTTLVVGPFYLTGALGLGAASVGLVMAIGPLVAALTGVPAGRIADRLGARHTTLLGLTGIATGSVALAALPMTLGIAGYLVPIVVITAGYAIFQTANNTNVMVDVSPDQRGVTSGLLNLSRNLGLIGGASVMGAIFSLGVGPGDIKLASPDAVAAGLHLAFLAATVLIGGAIAIAIASRGRAPSARASRRRRRSERAARSLAHQGTSGTSTLSVNV